MIERTISSDLGAQGFRFRTGTIPALVGFDIGWTRDDHHVKWLAIGPNTTAPLDSGDYLVALRDQDSSGHRISGTIKFEDFRGVAEHRQVSARGLSGEHRLRIPHLNPDQEFVLTGFLFEYESSDHHVLHIKLRQMAHNDHIYVNFSDNDGAARYVVSIKYAVIPSSMLARSYRSTWNPDHIPGLKTGSQEPRAWHCSSRSNSDFKMATIISSESASTWTMARCWRGFVTRMAMIRSLG